MKKFLPLHISFEYLQKKLSLWAIIFVGCFSFTSALALISTYYPQSLSKINLDVIDFILKSSPVEEAKTKIHLVEIDEASLKAHGQWPWPRYLVGDLLERINEADPAAVGINIMFPERDRTSPAVWQESLEKRYGFSMDTTVLPNMLRDNDIYLAEVLSEGPFVLGYEFLFAQRDQERPDDCALDGITLIHPNNTPALLEKNEIHTANGVVCNLDIVNRSAKRSGFLNGTVDSDGVMRRLPLLIRYQGEIYPSFALALLQQYFGEDVLTYEDDGTGIFKLTLPGESFFIDEYGHYFLNPHEPEENSVISAADLLDRRVSLESLEGTIVIVGLAASGLGQRYSTPFSPNTSMLQLHKYSIESLLAKKMTVRPRYFKAVELGVCFILMFILLFAISSFSVLTSVLSTFLAMVMVWIGCLILQNNFGILFSPLLPSVALVGNLGTGIILRFQYLQAEARNQAGAALSLLKSSEHSLQSILSTIPDIVFRLDQKGRIIYVSQAVTAYVDSPRLLLGKSIFSLVAPEDLDRAQFRMNERRTGERATRDLEICLDFSSDRSEEENEKRYFSVSSQGIYDDDSVGTDFFLGTQGIIKDITEKKRLEHDLLQAQKLEVVGSLAAGIAHDLNNILSGLVSYPDLLLREIDKDSELYAKIALIQKSGRKAAAIVHDLLTLARRNIDKSAACSINHIVREYIESVEFQETCKAFPKVTIGLELGDDTLNVKGSSIHLSKVVMNILQNGLEAMKEGGGTIVIRSENIYFDAPVHGYELIEEGEYVRLSIIDEGTGIAKEDIPRIFEPFFTRKNLGRSGTGLGMSVVWATIKDHKGFIDIQSELHKGTTLEIYLRPTRENVYSEKAMETLEQYGGRETIMVVDDIPEQLNIAKCMLQGVGYEVVTVSSGEKAVAHVKDHAVDLVVLDMIMPGGWDGLETYRQIIEIVPGQKSIITSGYSASERVEEVQKLGGGEYVQKPFSMNTFLREVRRELDRN